MRYRKFHAARIALAATAVLTSFVAGIGRVPAKAASRGTTSWTVYQRNASGTGVSSALTSVVTDKRAWTSPVLSGQMYGEPLVYSSDVYVATENDMVYALSATRGSVVWSRHVGTAVPSASLPCGNIAPSVGITGTPVIDPGRNEIFVVAFRGVPRN